ncbi:hypothetical protein GCM10023237_14540 [Streptomyces coeruleoprunus]
MFLYIGKGFRDRLGCGAYRPARYPLHIGPHAARATSGRHTGPALRATSPEGRIRAVSLSDSPGLRGS